jgi:hypothetical protein
MQLFSRRFWIGHGFSRDVTGCSKTGLQPLRFAVIYVTKLFMKGQDVPQGLKPASIAVLGGTAEAVPYPKPSVKRTLG